MEHDLSCFHSALLKQRCGARKRISVQKKLNLWAINSESKTNCTGCIAQHIRVRWHGEQSQVFPWNVGGPDQCLLQIRLRGLMKCCRMHVNVLRYFCFCDTRDILMNGFLPSCSQACWTLTQGELEINQMIEMPLWISHYFTYDELHQLGAVVKALFITIPR